MQTKTQPFEPFLTGVVGQLDKISFPTPKTPKTLTLELGRQPKKSLHTPTYAQGEFNFKGELPIGFQFFKLGEKAEYGFLNIIPYVFEELEKNIEVVFHNQNYVDVLFQTYNRLNAFLFLDWVKTIAIIRKDYRNQPIQGVIETQDDDFLMALRIFKGKNIKPKKKEFKNKDRVWEVINQYFFDKVFTIRDIKNILLIDISGLHSIFTDFVKEGLIKREKDNGDYRHIRYILVK